MNRNTPRYGWWRHGWQSLALLLTLLYAFTAAPAFGQERTRRDWLLNRAAELGARHAAERATVHRQTREMGLPLRRLTEQGRLMEVVQLLDGLPVYYLTQNMAEAQSIATDRLWSTGGAGFALSGAGVTVGLWDGGLPRATHQELTGRTTVGDGTTKVVNHATQVAATMAGTGLDGEAKGMAYEAEVQTYDWSRDLSEMAAAAAAGLRLSNHSYGKSTGWVYNLLGDGKWVWQGNTDYSTTEDYRFGLYDDQAEDWDAVAYNAPHYLIVKAAGNDRGEGPGPGEEHWVIDRQQYKWVLSTALRGVDGGSDGFDTIIDAGNAKNVLTVGAVKDVTGGYASPSDVVMTSFSAWGPTDDGRIKPDLVTDGYNVYTARSGSDTAYGTSSGTSMAAPAATGSLALLVELEETLRNGGAPYLSSTLKALLVHTADEAGPATGPDYQNGWGLMNTLRAAQVMQQGTDGFHVQELTLTEGATATFEAWSSGDEPLRVTIAWTDAPYASPLYAALNDRSPTLVSDLDVRLVGPGGTMHRPWVLDPDQPSAAATQGDNVRDNIEQVLVEVPAAGAYQVQVTHKGALLAAQPFSLVITGASAEEQGVALEVRALLEGPYQAGAMHTDLAEAGLLPTTQPFAAPVFAGTALHYEGEEHLDADFFATHPDIVDWVLIELRSDPATSVARQAALLTATGEVVGLSGSGPLLFDGVTAGDYYVALLARSHLGVLSAAPLALSASSTPYDFTTGEGKAYGSGATKEVVAGVYALHAGDGNLSGRVTASDQIVWLDGRGTGLGYYLGDYNFSGRVTASDQSLWLANRGAASQLPSP